MSRLEFTKEGKAIYISHLDLMRTMRRALLRAGMPVAHTEGFNPHADITIALPLPLGHSSCCELMDFKLQNPGDMQNALEKLNDALPEGIRVKDIYEEGRPFKQIEYLEHRLILDYGTPFPDDAAERLSRLFARQELVIFRKTKKSEGDSDIAPCIHNCTVSAAGDRQITVEAVLTAMRPMLNPTYLIAAIEKYAPDLVPDFVRYARLGVYDAEMKQFR